MARGKRTPDDARARAAAMLLTGATQEEAAEAIGVSPSTVGRWRESDPQLQSVATAREAMIADRTHTIGQRVDACLDAILVSLTRQAEYVGTPEYLRDQPAAGLAALYAVMADRAFRLLSAEAAGRGDTGQRVADALQSPNT